MILLYSGRRQWICERTSFASLCNNGCSAEPLSRSVDPVAATGSESKGEGAAALDTCRGEPPLANIRKSRADGRDSGSFAWLDRPQGHPA